MINIFDFMIFYSSMVFYNVQVGNNNKMPSTYSLLKLQAVSLVNSDRNQTLEPSFNTLENLIRIYWCTYSVTYKCTFTDIQTYNTYTHVHILSSNMCIMRAQKQSF